jgi:threonine dehydrogenase-like Zn-dependent dehydrogenase
MLGGRDDRLALAREWGAAECYNYHTIDGDLAEGLMARGSGRFPTVVEASGSAAAMQTSLDLVERCGKILVLGDYGGARAGFAWNHLLHREITLVGSNASAGAWPDAVQLAVRGAVPLGRLVTHRFPAARFAEGLDAARGRASIKVVIEW